MENKKPFEIIIKENDEIVYQAKTDCIFAVVNAEAVMMDIFLSKCKGIDLIHVLNAARDLTGKICHKNKEVSSIFAACLMKNLLDILKGNDEQ